jgi:hypothetical protein
VNICRSCSQDFASARAFDAHRIGKHAYTKSEGLSFDPPRKDGRRCLAPSEILSAGWDTNESGRWVHPQALRNRPKLGSYSLSQPSKPVAPIPAHPGRSERESASSQIARCATAKPTTPAARPRRADACLAQSTGRPTPRRDLDTSRQQTGHDGRPGRKWERRRLDEPAGTCVTEPRRAATRTNPPRRHPPVIATD